MCNYTRGDSLDLKKCVLEVKETCCLILALKYSFSKCIAIHFVYMYVCSKVSKQIGQNVDSDNTSPYLFLQ